MHAPAQVRLRSTKAELAAAELAVERMQQASTFIQFKQGWEDLFNILVKIWIKAERECEPVRNKFQPWQGPYKRRRRKDPLLAYVTHARNADHHTTANYRCGD